MGGNFVFLYLSVLFVHLWQLYISVFILYSSVFCIICGNFVLLYWFCIHLYSCIICASVAILYCCIHFVFICIPVLSVHLWQSCILFYIDLKFFSLIISSLVDFSKIVCKKIWILKRYSYLCTPKQRVKALRAAQ